MTGLDKIMEDIQAESVETIARIRKDADEKEQKIRNDAKESAEAACAKERKSGEDAVADRLSRAQSAAQLLRRKKLLAARQELISETIEQAQKDIVKLPEKEYFDLLLHMAAANALKDDGEICFNQKDLDRMPSGFASSLQKALPEGAKLTVSSAPADITGGFILVYNGIEENCSFEAIFAEQREEMQDKVRAVLFS